MGHRRFRKHKGRNISGIVLLDKSPGISSNAALQEVKKLFDARKAGHTGSLDPLATGLLPVCMGEATKISGFLLGTDKYYLAECKLGVKTSTADAEGEIISERPVSGIDEPAIRKVLEQYTGEISQIPPMYSALKHKGQPLYKLARQGIEVEREARQVTVYALDMVSFDGDRMTVTAHCSRGTYIRTLIEDIGDTLGCGAHITALRRTGLGPYTEPALWHTTDQMREILENDGQEALDRLILPMESALVGLQEVQLSEDTAYYLRQGQPVIVPHAPTEGWVRLFAEEGGFLGVGEILDDGRVAPRRLIALS